MWVVLNSRSTSWNPVERLIFPAPPSSYDLSSYPEELLLVPRDDGEKVPCIFLPFRHARFLVMYFHANAEDLGLCYAFCKIMRDLFQVHVLAVEYPGYGICGGKTDEAGILANADAAMRFVTQDLQWPCDGVKLFGRSLGTGPAVALATKYNVAGLILVSPFTSIQSLFRTQVGALADLVQDRFQNVEHISQVNSPTLIIHGQKDTLIPIDHGRALYDQLKSRKMMVCPATMGHNTSLLKNIGTLVLPMTQFFSLPDYTFEDIEVPAWAYPAERPAASPAPSIGCCAAEPCKDDDGDCAEFVGAADDLSAKVQPTFPAALRQQVRSPTGGPRALSGPRPLQVPRLRAADAAPVDDTGEELVGQAPPPPPPRDRGPGGEGSASRKYPFGAVPSLQLSAVQSAAGGPASRSARPAPRASHFREEVLDAVDGRLRSGRDVPRVPWSARGAGTAGTSQWRLAQARRNGQLPGAAGGGGGGGEGGEGGEGGDGGISPEAKAAL